MSKLPAICITSLFRWQFFFHRSRDHWKVGRNSGETCFGALVLCHTRAVTSPTATGLGSPTRVQFQTWSSRPQHQSQLTALKTSQNLGWHWKLLHQEHWRICTCWENGTKLFWSSLNYQESPIEVMTHPQRSWDQPLQVGVETLTGCWAWSCIPSQPIAGAGSNPSPLGNRNNVPCHNWGTKPRGVAHGNLRRSLASLGTKGVDTEIALNVSLLSGNYTEISDIVLISLTVLISYIILLVFLV